METLDVFQTPVTNTGLPLLGEEEGGEHSLEEER
jgi:hypothetical protein